MIMDFSVLPTLLETERKKHEEETQDFVRGASPDFYPKIKGLVKCF